MARRPRNVLSDPALALLWNHDHEMFSYLHKYCVLSLNCFLLTGVCLSLIPFITREPSNISPLILTPFLDFHLFHFESKSRGSLPGGPSSFLPVFFSSAVFTNCYSSSSHAWFYLAYLLWCCPFLSFPFMRMVFDPCFRWKFVFMGYSQGSFALVFARLAPCISYTSSPRPPCTY